MQKKHGFFFCIFFFFRIFAEEKKSLGYETNTD